MDIIETRRLLHQHPELGYEEHWTSQYIAQRLAELGYEIHEKLAHTGIVAIWRGAIPDLGAVAYRADMDALPIVEKTDVPFRSTNGCMHACGHDSHMAVAIDVAEKVAAAPRAKRDIAFVFQPNEEGAPGEIPSGADLMCREGVVERFGLCKMVALHSDPTLEAGVMGICQGAIWANRGGLRSNSKANRLMPLTQSVGAMPCGPPRRPFARFMPRSDARAPHAPKSSRFAHSPRAMPSTSSPTTPNAKGLSAPHRAPSSMPYFTASKPSPKAWHKPPKPNSSPNSITAQVPSPTTTKSSPSPETFGLLSDVPKTST